MHEAPFSTNFVLFYGELRMQHTVRTSSSPGEHAQALLATLDALFASGHTLTEGDLSNGCEREEVTGYVLAEDKDGNDLLFFYKSPLEYRVRGGCVYHDHFDKLPFTPSATKRWQASQAPSREEAERKGYLVPCSLEIVIRKTGKQTEKGQDIYKFLSVAKHNGKPVVQSTGSQAPIEEPRASSEPVGQVAMVGPESDEEQAIQLVGRIKRHVTSHELKTTDQLAAAADRACQVRSAIPDKFWPTVQEIFKARLQSFTKLAARAGRYTEAKNLVRRVGQVLAPGVEEQLVLELDALEAQAREAPTEQPAADGQDFSSVPF